MTRHPFSTAQLIPILADGPVLGASPRVEQRGPFASLSERAVAIVQLATATAVLGGNNCHVRDYPENIAALRELGATERAYDSDENTRLWTLQLGDVEVWALGRKRGGS